MIAPPFTTENNPRPMGRPKGSGPKVILEAIAKIEKKYSINYWEKAVELSLKNPQLMIAIMRKVVPDLQETELSGDVKINFVAPPQGIFNNAD